MPLHAITTCGTVVRTTEWLLHIFARLLVFRPTPTPCRCWGVLGRETAPWRVTGDTPVADADAEELNARMAAMTTTGTSTLPPYLVMEINTSSSTVGKQIEGFKAKSLAAIDQFNISDIYLQTEKLKGDRDE